MADNSSSTLCVHSGAEIVTRDFLAGLPTPTVKGPRHKPVAHISLIESIQAQCLDRGLEIAREEFAVQRENAILFGVFDLKRTGTGPDLKVTDEEATLSIGFRGSNDRQMAISMVAGKRIFVCDNLMLSGDSVVLRRKHTTGMDLDSEISEGLDQYLVQCRHLEGSVGRMKIQTLDDHEAKVRIFDAFTQAKVMPITRLPHVVRNYFAPDDSWTDCHDRTEWGLHNAFTREIRNMKTAPAFDATAKLGSYFHIGAGSN